MKPVNTVRELADTLRPDMCLKLLSADSHKLLGNYQNNGDSLQKMLSGYGDKSIKSTEKYKMWIVAYI